MLVFRRVTGNNSVYLLFACLFVGILVRSAFNSEILWQRRYLLAALVRVSVEFTYMGFSLLLVVLSMGLFFIDFMQQASPLEYIHLLWQLIYRQNH